MEDPGHTPITGDDDPMPEPQRACTRCDGRQHLVAQGRAMGKYRCDTCQMVVGFDLRDVEPEFLIDRGLPSRYTQDVFGERITPPERRLRPAPEGETVDA